MRQKLPGMPIEVRRGIGCRTYADACRAEYEFPIGFHRPR
jgi:hypothetical protein